MTELIRIGQGFFEDLATTPETEARLLLDSRLTEQEFAARHADTILDHYMNTFSFDFLREDAEFFAASIWHYLRARGLRNRNQAETKVSRENLMASRPGAAYACQAA
ncbi:hypothetical protein [Allochromatium tepidum]|uniref:Uncharacterized protein n=1 Tax=Allochromatium tepidum TaxID=553982 RepID=A0ABN6GFI5_9GAMM|nr:hypothetical protein [Allochromatium tepidum]BCU07025.1 hypothetical protein Atep_17020 [Allochromatium tepidum]